jgi:iron complex outermembrane receptor protein
MKYGAATIVLSAEQLGLAGADIYAAEYLVSTGNVAALRNGFEDKTIPNDVASLFATYSMPAFNDGRLKLAGGVVWAGETSGVYANAVTIPSYASFRASASYSWDRYTFDVAVENLFDKKYFYLGQEAYSEVAALPGVGRQFHFRLAAKF